MIPNQAIVLTPPGPGAIAVVRIMGDGVSSFLSRHFSRSVKTGRCVHGILADGAKVIDDPVIVLLPDRSSADINLHGGPWVVRAMLDLAASDGFAILNPPAGGPIPLDAVDGETVLDREILAHLPLARTELAAAALLAQADAWAKWLEEPHAAGDIDRILSDHSLWRLLHPPTVAIVGAANVGKSTLANQLFGQERSITADLPGTTRDWVGEIANIDGLAVQLVDTPGWRTTDDAIEQAAIAQSRAKIEQAQLILLILDATRPLEPEQRPLMEAYPDALCVMNKSDQPAVWNVADGVAIRTVATTGRGINAIRVAILTHFGCGNFEMRRPRYWTDRQREWLTRAAEFPTSLSQMSIE